MKSKRKRKEELVDMLNLSSSELQKQVSAPCVCVCVCADITPDKVFLIVIKRVRWGLLKNIQSPGSDIEK